LDGVEFVSRRMRQYGKSTAHPDPTHGLVDRCPLMLDVPWSTTSEEAAKRCVKVPGTPLLHQVSREMGATQQFRIVGMGARAL
jgi:hypothetical protein